MTVATPSNRINYIGNGILTVYPYPFPIFADADLKVYVNGVLKTLTTDYTVSGTGNPSGGNVTFVTPPGDTLPISILRRLALTQGLDLVDNDRFPAESVESELDRLTMIDQQQDEAISRSVKVPVTSTLSDVEVPDPQVATNQGKVVRIKQDGTGFDAVGLAQGLDIAVITTKGDLVRGGNIGAPERLAYPGDGQVLGGASGVPAWRAAAQARSDLGLGAAALLPAVLTQSFRGLHLRTHPDADKAASQVMLIHADEIVLDNGASVLDWNTLVANITQAGVGGLDTGAEAASTWYEAYAIRKSSDGTKGLILHRAKDYFTDSGQSFTTSDDAVRNLRILTSTPTDLLAQGFKTPTTGAPGPIEIGDFKLVRSGAVVGNIWFEIRADDGSGNPAASVLATSDKIDASKISTTATLIRLIWRTPASSADTTTQYHVVLNGDYARSDTVFIGWRGVAAGGYANGAAKQYNGSAWSAAAGVGDFTFRIYTTRNDTTVTMPSGYDQKCLLGYVYNDGSSNLRPIKYRNRQAQALASLSIGNVTATIMTLVDASTLLPPIPLVVHLSGGNATGATVTYVAGVPEGFDIANEIGSRIVSAAADNNPDSAFSPIETEYQGLYAAVSASTGGVWVKGWAW